MYTQKQLFESLGYNIVAYPRQGIKPLQILVKNGNSLSAIGNSIEDLFEEDSKLIPLVNQNEVAADIKDNLDCSLQASSGFNLLEGLLKRLNLGKLSGSVKFNDTDKVVLTFEDVKEDNISGFQELGDFIAGSMPKKTDFIQYQDQLMASELYVITTVLKSNNFTIKVIDNNNQNISSKIDVKEIVSVNGSIKRDSDNSLKITSNDKDELIFAFRAVHIFYDKDSWFKFWDRKKARFRIKEVTGWTLRETEDYKVSLLPYQEFVDLPL